MLVLATVMCMTYSSMELPNQKTMCRNTGEVLKVSAKHEMDPYLLVSLIYVESGWTPKAVSSAGACGLTQVMPKWSAGYKNRFGKKATCEQLFNAKLSINKGAKILRWWIDYHTKRNDKERPERKIRKLSGVEVVKRALCSYNAGFRCTGTKPHKSGMRYALKVMKYFTMLKEKSASLEDKKVTKDMSN